MLAGIRGIGMLLPHLDPACLSDGRQDSVLKSDVLTLHNVIPSSGLDCKQLFILSQKTIINALSKYKVGNFWISEAIASQKHLRRWEVPVFVKALPMVCLQSLTILRG